MNRDELIEAFAGYPARLAAAAKARVAEWQPFPEGDWSPIDTVRHLIAVEQQVHLARLTEVAREEAPHWVWTEPGPAPGFDDASLLEVLARHAEVGPIPSRSVPLRRGGWARTGVHDTYGRLDVGGLLRIRHRPRCRALCEPGRDVDAAG